MSDSHGLDQLAEKHERNREQRLQAIKRWVAYIQSEPPDTWGPQQNAVVNDQLDAATHADMSAEHRQYVKEVAADLAAMNDTDGE
ncbi:MAG: hypothetical protein ABEI52_01590 [Halobacteriaceae archaeon]